MKKYINFLNLIEVIGYLIVVIFMFLLEGEQNHGLYFTIIYWIAIFIINISYHTFELIKNKKTPKISIYSPTALAAYFISNFGMSFVNIKNNSYREFIKSANDYKNMSKKQRIESYIYYLLVWVIIGITLFFFYLDDAGNNQLAAIFLLLAFILWFMRVFILYAFAEKKEGVKNE